jgi:hypothetical protein
MIARAIDGQREGLSRDDILDNVTLYLLPRCERRSNRCDRTFDRLSSLTACPACGGFVAEMTNAAHRSR